jgi:hypothetical protein
MLRASIGAAAALLLVVQTGCVTRRMTVRTNPPGAMVYVDEYPIGTSPASTSFTYYGTRKFRVVKDGFETVVENRPIRAPWYEVFPLDFIAEHVVPWEIRDERVVDINLAPAVMVPPEQVVARGESLREITRGTGVPGIPRHPTGPAPTP